MSRSILFIVALLTLLGFQSCQKDHTQPEPDDIFLCVHQSYYSHSVQGPKISESQMDTIRELFLINHLSLKNLQITRVRYDTTRYYEIIHVNANQFINNLMVFYGDIGFHFRKINGIYTTDLPGLSFPDNGIHSPPIDSTYRITPLHAANMLYRQMVHDLNIRGWNADWRDSCYSVTLGASVINGYPAHDPHAKYGLVWKVTPQNEDYPVCFINALSGKIIYYFNGIIIN